MKRVFLFPARRGAIRAAVAISHALGYPRTVGGDPAHQRGGGRHVPARTVWIYARPRRVPQSHPMYATRKGALILDVSRPEIAALDGQTLTVPATYAGRAVPGGAGSVTVDLSLGRAFSKSEDNDLSERDDFDEGDE